MTERSGPGTAGSARTPRDVTVGAGGPLTVREFNDLFEYCSNWGRWGHADTRGALNHISQLHIVRAAALARTGTVVSCSRVLASERPSIIPAVPCIT